MYTYCRLRCGFFLPISHTYSQFAFHNPASHLLAFVFLHLTFCFPKFLFSNVIRLGWRKLNKRREDQYHPSLWEPSLFITSFISLSHSSHHMYLIKHVLIAFAFTRLLSFTLLCLDDDADCEKGMETYWLPLLHT